MFDLPTIQPLIQETVRLHLNPLAEVQYVEPAPMAEHEHGWTASQIQRYRVHLTQGEATTIILKTMPLKERLTMQRLTAQGHANTPFTYTNDFTTDDLAITCMQDLGSRKIGIPTEEADLPTASEWDQPIAQALAAIHHRNLGKQAELSWLPKADQHYASDFLLKDVWRGNWDHALNTNPAFAREFAAYTPLLERAADQLKRTFAALWQEGDSLTLTHGEIHGEHILLYQNKPYFIDWGWTYYGPFYLDLPAYFTPATVHQYRNALSELGVHIPETAFMERFREIGRYVGFKYLCSGIWIWNQGPTTITGRRILMTIQWAIDGIWPERAFNVSPVAWNQLLARHNASTKGI